MNARAQADARPQADARARAFGRIVASATSRYYGERLFLEKTTAAFFFSLKKTQFSPTNRRLFI